MKIPFMLFGGFSSITESTTSYSTRLSPSMFNPSRFRYRRQPCSEPARCTPLEGPACFSECVQNGRRCGDRLTATALRRSLALAAIEEPWPVGILAEKSEADTDLHRIGLIKVRTLEHSGSLAHGISR